MNIKTGLLRIAEGGVVAASTLGAGDGGNLNIQATEIEVSDALIDFTGAISGLTVSVDEGATGNGGNLNINAESLRVFNGGQITASSLGDGNAGTITLQVNEIEVSRISEDGKFPSRIAAFSETDFPAGSIDITTDNLSVHDGAIISVSNAGDAEAGNLLIEATNISLNNQASLQANVASGNQGNINLNSQFLLLENNSNITTNATGVATGGNITLETVNLVALDNSSITANALQGQGGNISITAQGIFLSPDSQITASSQVGVDGIVEINNPDVETNGELIELPNQISDPSEQIATGCTNSNQSQFIATGRGGIPATPHERLSSDRTWQDLRDVSAFLTQEQITQKPIQETSTVIEAAEWIVNSQGKVELIAKTGNHTNNIMTASCSGNDNL